MDASSDRIENEVPSFRKYKPSAKPREKPLSERSKTKARSLKKVMPIIADEVLQHLRSFYTPPVAITDPETAKIWELTGELKGWLTKKNSTQSWANIYWSQLRVILDAAIEKHDLKPFETFTESWQKLSIRDRAPTPKYGIKKIKTPIDPKAKRLADAIIQLTPNTTDRASNSPVTLDVIESIETLQQKLGRAPTQAEIVNRSGKSPSLRNIGGLSAAEVSRQVKKLNLSHLLSVG